MVDLVESVAVVPVTVLNKLFVLPPCVAVNSVKTMAVVVSLLFIIVVNNEDDIISVILLSSNTVESSSLPAQRLFYYTSGLFYKFVCSSST